MGRETKLLLGLLATLLGVFMGVLSMKLLVPRPPAGAGPDIHADVAATKPQDLVEPPQFATAPPQIAQAAFRDPASEPPSQPRRVGNAAGATTGIRDPFVMRAAATEPAMPAETASPAFEPRTADPARPPAAFDPPPVAGSAYVARPGDSWWSLAETVYGDGRLYRAVFAWNRTIDPRVSLVPGTPIDLPTRDRLTAAWPTLMPAP
ncbi:MAG: LysM peptidoglycan-binding domain-containing protein [Planctomycetaceae bacterium]